MVLLNNFNIGCNDVLKNSYVHEKPWKVDIVHAGQNPIFSQHVSATSANTLMASIGIQHSGNRGNFNYNFDFNQMGLDAAYKFKYLPGLKFTGSVKNMHEKKVDESNVKTNLSLEYFDVSNTAKQWNSCALFKPHFKFSMDPMLQKWTAAWTNGLKFKENSTFCFGAEASGLSNMKSISYVAGAAMSQTVDNKMWTLSLIGHPANGQLFEKFVGSIHCKSATKGSPEVGVEVTHYLSNSSPPTFCLGGKWFLNQLELGKKSDTFIKVKMNQDAKLAAALQHKLSDAVTLTVGTEFNAIKPDTAKCGVAFNMTL